MERTAPRCPKGIGGMQDYIQNPGEKGGEEVAQASVRCERGEKLLSILCRKMVMDFFVEQPIVREVPI